MAKFSVILRLDYEDVKTLPLDILRNRLKKLFGDNLPLIVSKMQEILHGQSEDKTIEINWSE